MTDYELYKKALRYYNRGRRQQEINQIRPHKKNFQAATIMFSGVAIWQIVSWLALVAMTLANLKTIKAIITETIPNFFKHIRDWRKSAKDLSKQKDKIIKQQQRIKEKKDKIALTLCTVLKKAADSGKMDNGSLGQLKQFVKYYTSDNYFKKLQGEVKWTKSDYVKAQQHQAVLEQMQQQVAQQDNAQQQAEPGVMKKAAGLAAATTKYVVTPSKIIKDRVAMESQLQGKISALANKQWDELAKVATENAKVTAAVTKMGLQNSATQYIANQGKKQLVEKSMTAIAASAGKAAISGAAKINSFMSNPLVGVVTFVAPVLEQVLGVATSLRVGELCQQFNQLQNAGNDLDAQEAILDQQLVAVTKLVKTDIAQLNNVIAAQMNNNQISSGEKKSMMALNTYVNKIAVGLGVGPSSEMAVNFSIPQLAGRAVQLGKDIMSDDSARIALLGVVTGIGIAKYCQHRKNKATEEEIERSKRLKEAYA